MYKRINERLKTISSEMNDIRKRMQTMPEGELSFYRTKGVVRLFRRVPDGGHKSKRIYLNHEMEALARKLAEKKYLKEKLRDLEREKKAVMAYLRHYDGTDHARLLWEKTDVFQKLLAPQFQPLSDQLADWEDGGKPYSENPEALIVKAPRGLVRSKSEAIIAWELYENKIPYRYENELFTTGGILHPDFTIRHPKSGKVFLWEHFGLMDNPQYMRNALAKIQTYVNLGYVPMSNFIMTFETAAEPLDMELVKLIVKHYFL